MRPELRALVVSGGWSTVFESVCDVVAERLGAARSVYQGAGHNVQNADGFNAGLLDHLSSAWVQERHAGAREEHLR